MSEGRKRRSSASTSASASSISSSSPNVDLIEKLSATPVPIILPPSYKPEAKFERYVNQLVGKIIMSAALISKTPGPKLKNTLLSQKGLLIKYNETIHICEAIAKDSLQLEILSVSGTKYIITTVKERSYYGVSTNLAVGGGVIIVVLEKAILIALYPGLIPPTESIPFVESFVSNTLLS